MSSRGRAAGALLLLQFAGAGRAAGAGGSATDLAVSFTLPADHWSTGAPADLTGAGSLPATDALTAAGWWYRVTGSDTWEHTLPSPTAETYSGPSAYVSQTAVGPRAFGAQRFIAVYDNDRPSATVRDFLCITNTDTAPLAITLFHYLDADAGGTPANDSAISVTSSHLVQADGIAFGEDIQYRAANPSAWAVRPASGPGNLLGALNDGLATQLDSTGTPAGPADLAAAYQFDLSIGPNLAGCAAVRFSSRVLERHVRGDVSFDNMPDILLQKPATGELHTWEMRRTERWQLSSNSPIPPDWDVVGWGDFNGNNSDQMLSHNRNTGEVFVGVQPLLGAPVLPLNWKVAATGDFDDDGHNDILWRNASSQKLVVWLMNGRQKIGNLIPDPDQAVDANWEVVGAADFHLDDGVLDLLWYNQTSGKLVVWTLDSLMHRITGGFTNPASVGNNNWKAVAAADYGRGADGQRSTPDILWRNDTSGKLVVWHMDSLRNRTSGVFTTPDAEDEPLAWKVVGPR